MVLIQLLGMQRVRELSQTAVGFGTLVVAHMLVHKFLLSVMCGQFPSLNTYVLIKRYL